MFLAMAACATTGPTGPTEPRSARIWPIVLSGADGLAAFGPRDEGRFGLDRLHVVSADAGDAAGATRSFFRVSYPKGSTSPADRGAPGGGAQFLGVGPAAPADHLFLRYRVRFAPGFEFVKGGKLPGFYGGRVISGGHIPDGTNGFSTRFMWRAGGAGELYAYLPGSVDWGTSLGRDRFRFQPGAWHCLEQEVALNAPGRADGVARVWLDGRDVFAIDTLTFRTVPTLHIEGVFFSTFFGGHDASWAPPADTHVDFADFAVGERRVGCD
jgi:hypothetical protein